MHLTGSFVEPQISISGKLRLVFEVNEKAKALEEIEKIKGDELVIDAKKYKKQRGLSANAYMWQLLDKMAKVIGVDKYNVYLMELAKYGVFADVQIKGIGLQSLKDHFRYTEILDEYDDDSYLIRCYYGSSSYTTKEMSDLINGVVSDAKDLGVETFTQTEIQHLLDLMGDRYGKPVQESF